MNIDEVIQQPGQRERILKEDVLRSIHVAIPAEIVSYDPDKRMATVQPVIRDWDSTENPPLLTDVPVFMWGNFTFTPQAGDGCLVICADSAVDSWLQSGGVSSPVVARTHSLSDGFALCGFNQTGGIDLKEALDEKVGLTVRYSDDLNQALDTGFYRYDTDSANVPLYGWGNVIVIKGIWGNNTIVSQIALLGDWTRLYARRKDASNNWSAWTMFANDSLVVHNTGAETVGGVKTFTDEPVFSTASNSAEINFGTKNLNNAQMGVIGYSGGSNGSGVYANGRFIFYEISAKSDGSAKAGSYERYLLPEVSAGVTSAVNYDIITTKNPQDIPGFPSQIYLTSTDNTWAKIWEKISVLANGDSATIYIQKNAMNVVSGGSRNDYSQIGVIGRSGTGYFEFILKPYSSENYALSCQISGCTSSSAGTYTEQVFDNSTLVHTTGNETISGEKRFEGAVRIANNSTIPFITFTGKNNTTRIAGIQVEGAGSSASGYYPASTMEFFNYSPNSDYSGLTSYYEMFKLPQVAVNLDGSKSYKIITEKNLSDIPGYPSQIYITSSDNTWEKVWAKISALSTGDSATIYIYGPSIITNGAITTLVHIGVISRTAASAFQYILKNSSNNIVVFNMTGVTSSTAGTYAGKTYDNDKLIHTNEYQTTDFGSVTIADFQTALDTLAGTLDEGAFASFKVSFTDTDTQITTSGAYTGMMTKGVSARRNAIIQASGSTALNAFIGSYTSSGWMWKKFVYDDAVVHTSGAETIGGTKTFTAYPVVKSGTNPYILFRGANLSANSALVRAYHAENPSEKYGQVQIDFVEYSPNSDGSARAGGYEAYQLPMVDVGISSSNNKFYNIITTKNLSDIDTSQLDGSTLPGVAHVQYTTIAKSTSKVFTMGNTSRVRIDFFGVANGLLGTTLVASTSTAGTCYIKSDLGSDITITKSGGTFTVANGNASYTLACYITLYGGSITY